MSENNATSGTSLELSEGEGTKVLASPATILPFSGYDSSSGNCLTRGFAVAGSTSSNGQNVITNIFVASDQKTIFNGLNISESATAAYGQFSASETGQFIRSLNIEENNICIVVSTSVRSEEDTQNVVLASNVSVPSSAVEAKNFFSAYGDSYISSTVNGAFFVAVYIFRSTSQTESDVIKAAFNGQYGHSSFSSSADFKSSLESISTSYDLNVKIEGANNPGPLPTTPDEIFAYAKNFGSGATNPITISFEQLGYDTIFPPGNEWWGNIAANRQYFITGTSDNGRTPFYSLRDTVQDFINTVKHMISVYNFYGYTADSTLTSALSPAITDLGTLNGQVDKYHSDPTTLLTVYSINGANPLPSLANGTPSLNVRVTPEGPYGSSGGGANVFTFPNTHDDALNFFNSKMSIDSVDMRHGDWIDCVSISYLSGVDATSPAPGPFNYGGNGGSQDVPYSFNPGDYISQVSVRHGDDLNHVIIVISAPPPSPNPTPIKTFSGGNDGGNWTIIPGGPVGSSTYIIGFCGHYGSELNGFGVNYGALCPATWTPFGA